VDANPGANGEVELISWAGTNLDTATPAFFALTFNGDVTVRNAGQILQFSDVEAINGNASISNNATINNLDVFAPTAGKTVTLTTTAGGSVTNVDLFGGAKVVVNSSGAITNAFLATPAVNLTAGTGIS